jgi:hypothetical protein
MQQEGWSRSSWVTYAIRDAGKDAGRGKILGGTVVGI